VNNKFLRCNSTPNTFYIRQPLNSSMEELKEAFVYASVNGVTGFTLYTGAAIFYGEQIEPAVIAGLGIGMLAFGSYLLRESDEVTVDIADSVPVNDKEKITRHFKNLTAWMVPSSVRRHGLFRFF